MPSLPLVLSGPILRRITPTQITFWMATSQKVNFQLTLIPENNASLEINKKTLEASQQQVFAGEKLYFQLININLDTPLPTDEWIGYDLTLVITNKNEKHSWRDWAPHLTYPGKSHPGFILRSCVRKIMHGSCRKPHHDSKDGLVRVDNWLASNDIKDWPAALIMSGDQVYVDDVATPMLVAIHQLIPQLGIPNESFINSKIESSTILHTAEPHYTQRENLLPTLNSDKNLGHLIFSGARKPVFTSINAQNHLVSLAEVLTMYLMVWSPACWNLIDIKQPSNVDSDRFEREKCILQAFQENLSQVQRVMANIPCAMIFDDHDITDDWNLTAEWEQAAYDHPFSKRIIGNALIGYFICQGWGNAPENFTKELLEKTQNILRLPGDKKHDELINTLLRYPSWHYQWNTSPPIVVLDTRTHRWRSERNLNKPSGLMDWEMLTDLQQNLLGKEAVILVSPAPMFGVKLIEVIQRAFTWFGKPLVVDAENWMAHPGSANALLNLFRHKQTPEHFVILSGDVHYSFVYQVEWRSKKNNADIWQITSSGIKNEFPKMLLEVLDRLNRWLYSPRSPLNWFTRRRALRIIPHKPKPSSRGERLVNASGLCLVEFNEDGSPHEVTHIGSDDQDIIFEIEEGEARWE
ncbi:alkaline phosphatase D family protein [Pleionea sediminis]|uniref:alkaline phosphatase D family protein n=1 Tax=Pleionea sediminis TaxID=2569479 RepID=UPI001184AF8B|nr:alkaline phosphatase D family protein [Pleionea sediminis]